MRYIFLLMMLAISACALESPQAQDTVSISTTSPYLATGERIVAFQFVVTGGSIRQIPVVPPAWSLTVNNDDAGSSEMVGLARYGASALNELFFRNFVIVTKKITPEHEQIFRLRLAVTADYIHERWIEVPVSGQMKR